MGDKRGIGYTKALARRCHSVQKQPTVANFPVEHVFY